MSTRLNRIGREVGASIGVTFVAIPLSLGIALASGVPPATALLSAAIGGIVVGAFSGSPLVVSGPAAGLAALVLYYGQMYGLTGLAVITLMSGVFQLLIAGLRAGSFFKWVPQSVLTGMLAAIGILIGVAQLHVMAGQETAGSFATNLVGLAQLIPTIATSSIAFTAASLGAIGIAIQLAWPRLPKLGGIPAAIPVVLGVTLLALPFDLPRLELAQLGDVVSERLGFIMGGEWFFGMGQYTLPAFVLALVGAAESLLTARAVDQLRRQRGDRKAPRSDLNKELAAQGAGNLTAGLIGGIPITGVIVRSGANVQFGAQTRTSTILHGVWILAIMLAFTGMMESIPLTALAAILVVTAYRLVNPAAVLQRAKDDRLNFGIWAVTCLGILFTDLLLGLGMGLSAAFVANHKTAIARARRTARMSRRRLLKEPAHRAA